MNNSYSTESRMSGRPVRNNRYVHQLPSDPARAGYDHSGKELVTAILMLLNLQEIFIYPFYDEKLKMSTGDCFKPEAIETCNVISLN